MVDNGDEGASSVAGRVGEMGTAIEPTDLAPGIRIVESAPPPRSRRRRWIVVVAAIVVGGSIVASGLFAVGLLPGFAGAGRSGNALTLTVRSTPASGYAPFDATLTAHVAGGTPPYSVTWHLPGGGSDGGLSAQLYIPSPGDYSITATAIDASGTSAIASLTVASVSLLPGASTVVPAPLGNPNVALAITWTAAASVTSCVLAGWGFLSVPPFDECSAEGGVTRVGTVGSGVYPVNPDDPEATPVMFQAVESGIAITVSWWYNASASVESFGSTDLTTAVAPL